jgi:protein-S-isoprenylcysteine O-methyltransferase Ste14
MLELAGILKDAEIVRQRRRGDRRSLVTSGSDRDPASVRRLALTWWPAGIAALVLVPLIGITARINSEERELTAGLPGYRDYNQGRRRLIPRIW